MEQINWEYALHDVMDNIFKYLNQKELCNAATVCKSWHVAANRQRARRCYIQRLYFPYEFSDYPKLDNRDDLLKALSYPALDKMLDVYPYASVLIDSSLGLLETADSFGKDLLEVFKKKLPSMQAVIVLRSLEIFTTTDDTLYSLENEVSDLVGGTLGLFFPNVENRAQVQMAYLEDDEECYIDPTGTADRFAEELGLNNCEHPKSTILLFFEESFYDDEIAIGIISKIVERVRNGEEITWTVVFTSSMIAAHYNREDYFKDSVHMVSALRISGLNVNSWRTAINIFARPNEIDRKLQELKRKVVPGRHCTGLISSINPEQILSERGIQPVCDSRRELMRKLKCIFPDIPFVGLFHECEPMYLPPVLDRVDLLKLATDVDDSDFFGWFFLTEFIWVMIISYD